MGAITPFRVPDGVDSEKFRHVIGAAYTAWVGTGGRHLPDADDVMEYVSNGMLKQTVMKYMGTPEFENAIKMRGVPWDQPSGLTTQQMLALAVMTDPTNKKTPAAKLKAIGVSYSVYRAWTKQPAFKRYLEKVTEGIIQDHIPDMQVALTNKAIEGDLNAIKFIYEMTGKHDPASKEVIQLRALVQSLLEILTRHLSTQPELLQAVAQDIQLMMPKAITQGEVIR